MERNTTTFPLPDGRSLLIYEPCNTASNFAYYHMVTALARRKYWLMGRPSTRALAQVSVYLNCTCFMYSVYLYCTEPVICTVQFSSLLYRTASEQCTSILYKTSYCTTVPNRF